MPVNLQSTPIANATNVRIGFYNGQNLIKSLDADAADVLTITFDAIGLFNPPNQPIMRTQNPGAAVAVPPGNVASVSTRGGRTLLLYGVFGGQEQRIIFT